MSQLFTNAARSLLQASILSTDTSLTVEAAKADLFPVANTTDWFKATLQDSSGNIEIVRVNTRAAASAIFTIVRAQEGTTARAYVAGSVVGLRITAADVQASIATAANLAAAGGAALVGNTPAGNIAASTVQAAINELDAEKQAVGNYLTTGGALGTPSSGAADNLTSNTEAVNNNSTQIATTAFVVGQAGTAAPAATAAAAVVGTSLLYSRQDHVHATGAAASQAGRLLRITRYTTAGSGTWTKPADTVSVRIITIAGGGGGGGASATSPPSGENLGASSNGGDGAGAGASEIYIASAAASYAYVVGAGGAGGAAGNNAGAAGAATTIAGIAGGGGGGGGGAANGQNGNGGTSSNGSTGAPGATPTGGTVNTRAGFYQAGAAVGGLPAAARLAITAVNTAGAAGALYGGGGYGAKSSDGGVSRAGGAGGRGYIEIQEYS